MPHHTHVTPALHSAGATVFHESPFNGLSVPVSSTPLEQVVRDRWVKPIYMTLPDDLGRAADVVISQYSEIRRELIAALLAQFDWRPRIVGAFLVALDERVEFEGLLGKLLLRSDVCYAGQGYCLALAQLNTPGASAFLTEYLRYYLTRVDLWFDQAFALAALRYLDAINGTRHSDEFAAAWARFIQDKPAWSLDASCDRFEAAMSAIASLRARCLQGPPRND